MATTNQSHVVSLLPLFPGFTLPEMILPSSPGTWRDSDNFNARWGNARTELGVPDITSHSFRKSVATLIDEGGLSARKSADRLGHARVSETQDVYMARGRVHSEIAEMLDQARKNDE
jgi:integrase